MALLAVLAVSFAGEARTHLLIARNEHESARARALADAGIALGILDMVAPQAERRPADGAFRDVALAHGTVRIAVQDEAGKIDLNEAPRPLLVGLIEALGATPEDALHLGDEIVAWKAHRLAEASGSRAARRQPAFLAVEELARVPGIGRDLVDRMRPFVTVHSRRPRIDPGSAPAEVLRALPGIKPSELDAFLAARQQGGSQRGALPPLTAAAGFIAYAGAQTVTVRAEGLTENGTRFTREAVITLTRGTSPYRVLAWR
jgi:general secretion pathway protein K